MSCRKSRVPILQGDGMKTELSSEQIKHHRTDGYTIVEDFLNRDELEAFRTVLDEALAERGSLRIPGQDQEDFDEDDDPVFLQRVNLWTSCPAIKELILDPRIGKICSQLEGVDAYRIWHDHCLIKRPWDNPTSWHRDNPNWSFYSEHSISIWIALDDATIQNGCLYFLPCTHRLEGFKGSGIPRSMNGLFKTFPDWATIKPEPVELKAGSCTFHNGLLAHAAGPNMTTGLRRAFVAIFMPVGSTFNGIQNILTEDHLDQLEVGDELCDDALNPIVYQK